MRGKKKIGFVPTMGAFHEGHLSLLRAAQRACDYQVVSLFVNPLQFGPEEDFDRYPRDLPRDRAWALANHVDLLFLPKADEIVPVDLETFVSVESLSRRWEGASRPQHFRGVATIVAKLFQIVRPDIAYFGQKDYQQATIIRQMVRDLYFDIKIKVMPTLREKDGLAKSSRNALLSHEDRAAATVLYRALCSVQQSIRAGTTDCHLLKKGIESIFKKEPRAQLDYAAFCDPNRLEPIRHVTSQAVLLLAAKVGSVRLIDNLLVRPYSARRNAP